MTRGRGAKIDRIGSTSVRPSAVSAVGTGNFSAGAVFPSLRLFAMGSCVTSAWQRRRHRVVTVGRRTEERVMRVSVITRVVAVVIRGGRRRRRRKRASRSGRRSSRRVERRGRRSGFSRRDGRRRRTSPRSRGRRRRRALTFLSTSALSKDLIAFRRGRIDFSVFVFSGID